MITLNGNPMLACGSIDLGPGFRALVYFVIGLWIVTFVLFSMNLRLTFFTKNSSSFKIVNVQILSVYTILGIGLFVFGNSMAQDNLGFTIGCALVFLIPLMVMVHFICLLVSVRRRRRRLESVPVADTKEKQGQ